MNVEMNAPTMITGGIALIMLMLISLIIRRKHSPADTLAAMSAFAEPTVQQSVQPVAVHTGPALPSSGLPDGWTMEQWQHYGEQYLAAQMGQQSPAQPTTNNTEMNHYGTSCGLSLLFSGYSHGTFVILLNAYRPQNCLQCLASSQ